MRNSDGIESVRSHLSKIGLNPAMILILSSLVVWPECSVSYTFDVNFLIALKEEFSARLKANTAGAGFCPRRDRGNFDTCFSFQHDPHPIPSLEVEGPLPRAASQSRSCNSSVTTKGQLRRNRSVSATLLG